MVLRVELITQILRVRTLVALASLAAVPVAAGIATAGEAGHQNRDQGGLFGAAPYSALNHTMASLEFIGPLLLPIVVAVLACAIGSADRDWGTLRYLYVAPVTRTRLLVTKLAAVAIATTAAVACVLVPGLATGLVVFGWHPFQFVDSPALTTGEALRRVLAASGYTLLCMLAIAAIAFFLATLLPRGAEAVGATIAFVVAASILNAQPTLHPLAVALPVHYWQNWLALFDPGAHAHLGTGVVVQVLTILVSAVLSLVVLRRRDPAA